MPATVSSQDREFRRILSRNILLPLLTSILSAVVFVGLLFYLLSVLEWADHSERVLNNGNAVTKELVDMETGLRGYLLGGDEVFLEPYLFSKPKVQTALPHLMELVGDNPAQVDRLTIVRGQVEQWDRYAQDMIGRRRANQAVDGAVLTQRGKTQFDEIRRLIDDFQAQELTLRQERQDWAHRLTITVGIVYILVAVAVGIGLALNGRRQLVSVSTTFRDALEKQSEQNVQLQEVAWQRTGQSELAGKGLGQLGMSQLAATLLEFLTAHLNAKVGAVYLCEDDEGLRWAAGYGTDAAYANANRRFARGEGLIGQAVVERRLMRVDAVPQHHLRMTSGVMSADPATVVILPVMSDGKAVAVVELGWLDAVPASHVDFLRTVADNIGTAIVVTASRQKTQQLLEETQQLNEEMQVQQEELRTANEELEEQSRALSLSQANLEQQQLELEQTNATLHDQAGELDRRARDLEQASEYKSQFLANMSHELRTPLNSALILSKMLADNRKGNLDDEQVGFAQTIHAAGNDLLTLINDILDIAKVEAGKMDLVVEPVAVQAVVDGMRAVFEPLARDKRLAFSATVAEGTPATVATDVQRLNQVLKNLLSNALKFTASGRIGLAVDVDADGGMLRLAVSDTGIGIGADQHQRIFEAFQQADGSTSRHYGGTGLGLAISRDLAGLLGGAIAVDSTPGQGSTFTLTLPLDAPAQAAAPRREVRAPAAPSMPASPRNLPAPATAPGAATAAPVPASAPSHTAIDDDRALLADGLPDGSRGAVLVVEDDPAFAQLLCLLVREQGFHCVSASNAEQGLADADRYQPMAILLDVGLPDHSGMSLLQQLKRTPNTRHIQVHMVSGVHNIEVALHLGAVGYTLKPATRDLLIKVLDTMAERAARSRKRVLLVEDDARQRASLTALIGEDGVDIVAVDSGEAALDALRSDVFDCMVVDLKLPDMQGNDLLERMANGAVPLAPPVIVYTGRSLTRQEEQDLYRYSRSIIVKGARSPERLLDEVTLFLHHPEAMLSSERQAMLQQVRNRDDILDGRRVLLVDDDMRNVFALTRALEMQGAIVEVGRDGLEALAKLDTASPFDLVLMDVMMPNMDGLEATRRIRQDPRFKRLPIIAVTAKAMQDDQDECIGAGANDYLSKPIDIERLYSLIRVWVTTT